jgi:hypothetical protein
MVTLLVEWRPAQLQRSSQLVVVPDRVAWVSALDPVERDFGRQLRGCSSNARRRSAALHALDGNSTRRRG